MSVDVSDGCPSSPPQFYYTKENMVLVKEPGGGNLWQSMGMTFGVQFGCTNCGKDCLTSHGATCKCALKSGKFAYNKGDILKADLINEVAMERPLEYCNQDSGCYCANILSDGTSTKDEATCSSHRPRTFITECNSKCACHSMCGNHMIQHGMMVKVQVRYGILSMD